MRRLLPLVLVLLCSATALAYVLPGEAILKRVAVHRSELKLASLVVQGELTLQGAEASAAAQALGQPEQESLVVPVTITYKLPGRCRIELAPAGVQNPPAGVNVNGTVRTVGAPLASLKLFAAYVCPLLDQRGGREGLHAYARSVGIDTAKVSYGRQGSTVAYVIGGKARDANVPSLWIEKERFEPLRLGAKDAAGFVDVRLIDYSSAAAGEWHPRQVELRRAGELLATFSLDKVTPNTSVPDAVF